MRKPLDPAALPHSRLTLPTRSLVQGGEYVSSAATDITKTFERHAAPAKPAAMPLRVVRRRAR